MPTPKGGGMQLPIGDSAAMTVSPIAAADQRKAVRQVVRLARTPAEAREALDALGLTEFAVALAGRPNT
jgi:hypothetical protein